jgi:hypothetical protein
MRVKIVFLIILPLVFSCSHKDVRDLSEASIRKEIMETAVKYAKEKFQESKETIASDGVVTIADSQISYITRSISHKSYIIDPLNIKVGLINEDEEPDAIITILGMNDQDLESLEHLIIIKSEGKYILSRAIESNMKVLGIKDRIITAEVSSRSLRTPLRDCHECKEVVKYKFKSGDLIKTE